MRFSVIIGLWDAERERAAFGQEGRSNGARSATTNGWVSQPALLQINQWNMAITFLRQSTADMARFSPPPLPPLVAKQRCSKTAHWFEPNRWVDSPGSPRPCAVGTGPHTLRSNWKVVWSNLWAVWPNRCVVDQTGVVWPNRYAIWSKRWALWLYREAKDRTGYGLTERVPVWTCSNLKVSSFLFSSAVLGSVSVQL